MNKKKRQILAIVLLVAFGLWIVLIAFPIGGAKSKVKQGGNNKGQVYEPKFKKEGELHIMRPTEGDTLVSLDIEFADTPSEIQYGMMYRKSMDKNTAMLFLMPDERNQSFWMSNTYVSLDIIYINSSKEIVSIQRNATPLSKTSLPSEGPALYVLEVKGGLSDELGLGKGMIVDYARM